MAARMTTPMNAAIVVLFDMGCIYFVSYSVSTQTVAGSIERLPRV